MKGGGVMRLKRFLVLVVLSFGLLIPAAPAHAHEGNCVVAVHVGGIHVHPNCG